MSSHILVIDDDADLRVLVRVALARLGGYRVDTARNGAEGIAAAKSLRPDIVLLDMTLPDCEGTDVLRSLASDRDTKDIIVIILSASASRRSEPELAELGAAGVIAKPFNPPTLVERVKTIVARVRP
ncbi:MAG: response regulator [Polyangiaceae bacterium]|nr:response regulator [Polyangiaceae bacterium]